MDHVLYLLTLLDETHGKVSLPFFYLFFLNLCTFCPPLCLPLSVIFSLPLSLYNAVSSCYCGIRELSYPQELECVLRVTERGVCVQKEAGEKPVTSGGAGLGAESANICDSISPCRTRSIILVILWLLVKLTVTCVSKTQRLYDYFGY